MGTGRAGSTENCISLSNNLSSNKTADEEKEFTSICSNPEPNQRACMLAHDLISKVSVIVGYCDLLRKDPMVATKYEKPVRRIYDIAQSIVQQLKEHQCPIAPGYFARPEHKTGT